MKKGVKCHHCGKIAMKETGQINRAKKRGMPIYCDKACFGLANRHNRSKSQSAALKAQYDKEYRAKNREALKVKKAEWYQKTRDPEKERRERKKKMHRHVEYCRRPEYVRWKKEYDRQYRCKRDYGPLWEIKLLELQINDEVKKA